MNKPTLRRQRPAKPTTANQVHEVRVVPMSDARLLLKSLYLNLKSAIDQETLVDFCHDGKTTNVAFVIGTKEMKFNLVEGDQL